MDTEDEDTEDDEGYRRCFSRPYSASSDSQGFSSSDEDERNFISQNTNTSNNRNRSNQSSSNSTTNNNETSQTNQLWFKPWAWYAAHHNTPGTRRFNNTSGLTVNGVDSDATISSGDEYGLHS